MICDTHAKDMRCTLRVFVAREDVTMETVKLSKLYAIHRAVVSFLFEMTSVPPEPYW